MARRLRTTASLWLTSSTCVRTRPQSGLYARVAPPAPLSSGSTRHRAARAGSGAIRRCPGTRDSTPAKGTAQRAAASSARRCAIRSRSGRRTARPRQRRGRRGRARGRNVGRSRSRPPRRPRAARTPTRSSRRSPRTSASSPVGPAAGVVCCGVVCGSVVHPPLHRPGTRHQRLPRGLDPARLRFEALVFGMMAAGPPRQLAAFRQAVLAVPGCCVLSDPWRSGLPPASSPATP